MKTGKVGLAAALTVLLLGAGCSLGSLGLNKNGAAARDVGNQGWWFQAFLNPIFTYDTLGHFSSDPAVEVVKDESNGKETLMVVTSTDLEINSTDFPMDGVHLFTTQAENGLRGADWFEHGNVNSNRRMDPLFTLSDFGVNVKDSDKRMFAPDIQLVKGTNQIFLYIPYRGNDNKWYFGMAHANAGNGQLYDNFVKENAPFVFTNGKGGKGDFLNDPGVFYHELGDTYYMTYVDTAADEVDSNYGNISIAELNDDMKSGTRLGNINFAYPYDKFMKFKEFSEGPDIHILPGPNGERSNYYLIFSGTKQGNMIGYAMANNVEFAFNPTTCWKFKGWIMQDTGSRNNHANLIHFSGKNYLIYHMGPSVPKQQSRQVCLKEIELNDDGTIFGVRAPNDPNDLADYASLEGAGSSIGRGFIEVQDTSYLNNPNQSTIHIKSIRNLSGRDLYDFKMVYYMTIEPGRYMTLTPVQSPNLEYGHADVLPLRHLGSKIWAVIVDFSFTQPFKKNTYLSMDRDLVFEITAQNNSNDKKNDYSHPRGAHTDLTTTIALFDENGDPANPAAHPPILGDSPNIPQGTTKYLRNGWIGWISAGVGTYLNLPDTNSNETVKLNNRVLDTGSTAQEWYIEEVPAITIKGKTYTFPNHEAIRIKNLRTAGYDNGKGYYVTCNDINRNTWDNPLYYVQNQKLRTDWSTQVWIKEPVDGFPGRFRLRCFWDSSNSLDKRPDSPPLYLTLNRLGDEAPVYCQRKDGGGRNEWASQHWYIE